MVAEGKTQALSSELFFESARSYAVSKGAKAAEKDAASTYFVVDSTTYFVVFTRAANGGTMFSVRNLDDVRKDMANHFRFGQSESFQKDLDARIGCGNGPGDREFMLGGIPFQGDPECDKLLSEIVHKLTDEVDKRLKVDEQSYHYVMEEAEWAAGRNSFCQELLDDTDLLEIEYAGARQWAQIRSDKRVASAYMEADVWPDLRILLGDDKAACIRAVIFGSILDRNQIGVDAIRGQYAAAFVKNLGDDENPDAAKDWKEVLELVVEKAVGVS